MNIKSLEEKSAINLPMAVSVYQDLEPVNKI